MIAEDNAYVLPGPRATPASGSRPPHIIVDATRRFAVYTDDFLGVLAHRSVSLGQQRGASS